MDYAFICEGFPRLEYLFGCYLPRSAETARVDSDRIIRRFALNKPAALHGTIIDLEHFLRFASGQPNPERTCRRCLILIDSPLPTDYTFDTFGWLLRVAMILRQYSEPIDYERLEISAAAEYEPLLKPAERHTKVDMPLKLPSALLVATRELAGNQQRLGTFGKLSQAGSLSEKPAALRSANNAWVATNQDWVAAEVLLEVPSFA